MSNVRLRCRSGYAGVTLQTYGRYRVGDHVATPTLTLQGVRKARITEIRAPQRTEPYFVVEDQFGVHHALEFQEIEI